MQSLGDIQQQVAGAWFAEEVAAVASAAAGDDTQALMAERSARCGAMPPLHRRDEREAYRVLEGRVTFFVGGERVVADSGDVVVAPAGAARTFRVESDTARWLVVTRVRSVERFQDFARAVTRPLPSAAAEWPSSADRTMAGALAAANGIELLGPPGALPR